MKKSLSMMILVLAITIGLQFVNESKANAERVYAFSLGNVNFYVEIDYSHFFAAVLSNDGGGGYAYPYQFAYGEGYGKRLNCQITYTNGSVDFVTLEESRMAQAVSNVLRNHPKFSKQIEDALYIMYHREEIEEQERQRAEQQKRAEEERQKAEKIRAEQERNNKFNALIAEGDRYYNAKDYENARKIYQQARQINNSKVDEYCNELIKNGDYLESVGKVTLAFCYAIFLF